MESHRPGESPQGSTEQTVPPPGRAPEATPADTATASDRLAVDSVFEADAALRRGLTENLKPLRAQSEAIADRVDRAFADFRPNRLSSDELERRNFLDRGADVGEALDKVVLDGVERRRSSETEHAITFRDRAKLADEISDAPGSSGGVVELDSLLHFVERKSRGSSVVSPRTRPTYKAELEADEIVAAVEGMAEYGGATAEASSNGASSASREADQLVRDSVNRQMKSAVPPEAKLEYGSMPSIPNTAGKDETQSQILETFQLRPGASDVTAYHDFHTLQIAFPHVWTRIFDGELETLGRDLYREYVKLKDFSGSTAADPPMTSLADLRRLIDEIRSLSRFVEEDIPVAIRGGDDPAAPGTKSSDDLGDAARVGVAIATGGASELFAWALAEFSKIGQKPIITWEEFPGPWAPRHDKVHVSFTPGAAPPGMVDIVLKTDPGSHLKIIEYEPYDPQAKKFVHGPSISNWGQVQSVSMLVEASKMASGVLEFASQETPTYSLGRYVLADLGRKLPDRSRVTFHWKDN